MALTERSRKVFDYLMENQDKNLTAADIAEALGGEAEGFGKKSIDGIVTRGLQAKGLTERIPAEMTLEDGSHKPIKLIKLTELGKVFDPDAKEEA